MVIRRLKSFGKRPLCNLKKERAPHFLNFCFPLCWRCTATIVSALCFKYFFVNFTQFNHNFQTVIIGILLLVPMIIDGLNQYILNKLSTNLRRIYTGVLAGIGICLITN